MIDHILYQPLVTLCPLIFIVWKYIACVQRYENIISILKPLKMSWLKYYKTIIIIITTTTLAR